MVEEALWIHTPGSALVREAHGLVEFEAQGTRSGSAGDVALALENHVAIGDHAEQLDCAPHANSAQSLSRKAERYASPNRRAFNEIEGSSTDPCRDLEHTSGGHAKQHLGNWNPHLPVHISSGEGRITKYTGGVWIHDGQRFKGAGFAQEDAAAAFVG